MVPEGPVQPGTPSQQLGAAPGTTVQTEVVLGYRVTNEPESVDGLEFASSGEAELAPRDDIDDDIPEEVLTAARLANLERDAYNEREAGNLGMGFDAEGAGEEGAIFSQAPQGGCNNNNRRKL